MRARHGFFLAAPEPGFANPTSMTVSMSFCSFLMLLTLEDPSRCRFLTTSQSESISLVCFTVGCLE